MIKLPLRWLSKRARKHEICRLRGESYAAVLARLHESVRPSTYFEIGTLRGETLKLAKCKSIAVDPKFRIASDVIGAKPCCLFFQTTSDDFFRDRDPAAIFGAPIDFAFIDGLHLFEYALRDFANTERHCRPNSVIVLHDCVPADRWMAERVYTDECRRRSTFPDRWAGDVWKILPALKKYRPDLKIAVVDAEPTGLVLITRLDPQSNVLSDNYDGIVQEFSGLDIAKYGIARHQDDCAMISTRALARAADVAKLLGR